uniref:Uncharacterized protein n=1 Tax=Anguilla anguilla TaxID=7936 RepID=A0A0E9R7U5_ANGAN
MIIPRSSTQCSVFRVQYSVFSAKCHSSQLFTALHGAIVFST